MSEVSLRLKEGSKKATLLRCRACSGCGLDTTFTKRWSSPRPSMARKVPGSYPVLADDHELSLGVIATKAFRKEGATWFVHALLEEEEELLAARNVHCWPSTSIGFLSSDVDYEEVVFMQRFARFGGRIRNRCFLPTHRSPNAAWLCKTPALQSLDRPEAADFRPTCEHARPCQTQL